MKQFFNEVAGALIMAAALVIPVALYLKGYY
jgi:hypothetical protein